MMSERVLAAVPDVAVQRRRERRDRRVEIERAAGGLEGHGEREHRAPA